MKKILNIIFIITLSTIAVGLFATNRTKQAGEVVQGQHSQKGGGIADTIVVSDTVNYVYFVTHYNSIWPELSLLYTKVGAGTATLKVDVTQSVDGTNYYTVKKGAKQIAYTKTYTIAATGVNVLSFENDTAYLAGRYLKYTFSTTSTASVKGKLTLDQKINIR